MSFIIFSVVAFLVLGVFVPAAVAKARKCKPILVLANVPSAALSDSRACSHK